MGDLEGIVVVRFEVVRRDPQVRAGTRIGWEAVSKMRHEAKRKREHALVTMPMVPRFAGLPLRRMMVTGYRE